MLTNAATILRVIIAILFLLLVGLGAPMMQMPMALAAWALVLIMAYVDLWCLRRMRSATRGTRALLSEAMALTAAGSILATSIALSAMNGTSRPVDAVLLVVILYFAWRGRVVLRHLRAGTEPAQPVSGIEDSRRMISQLKEGIAKRKGGGL